MYSIRMGRHALKKEKWTITFDPSLKGLVQDEAKRLRVYPVQLLETMVRERLNPYGFQSIRDSVAHVNAVREESRSKSDKSFLAELKRWQKA